MLWEKRTTLSYVTSWPQRSREIRFFDKIRSIIDAICLITYAMKNKVEAELNRLEREGIIEPIQFADWVAPIAPVLKSDKTSIRICNDFKLTVNQASILDKYPIPKIEHLFTKIAGGKSFTKLHMSQEYQQIPLNKESRSMLCSIHTMACSSITDFLSKRLQPLLFFSELWSWFSILWYTLMT